MIYVIFVALPEHTDGEDEGQRTEGGEGTDAAENGDGLENGVDEEDQVAESRKLQDEGFGQKGEEIVLRAVDFVPRELVVPAPQFDLPGFVADPPEKQAHQIIIALPHQSSYSTASHLRKIRQLSTRSFPPQNTLQVALKQNQRKVYFKSFVP